MTIRNNISQKREKAMMILKVALQSTLLKIAKPETTKKSLRKEKRNIQPDITECYHGANYEVSLLIAQKTMGSVKRNPIKLNE